VLAHKLDDGNTFAFDAHAEGENEAERWINVLWRKAELAWKQDKKSIELAEVNFIFDLKTECIWMETRYWYIMENNRSSDFYTKV